MRNNNYIFKIKNRICNLYLNITFYCSSIIPEKSLENKILIKFSKNSVNLKKTLLREGSSFQASAALGLFKRYIQRQVKKRLELKNQFAICRLRGIGDSLAYYHSIWFLEKKRNEQFQFIGIPLFPHREIIQFIFGEKRFNNELKFLENFIESDVLHDIQDLPKELRFKDLIYKYALELFESFISESKKLDLENEEKLKKSNDRINQYSLAYQKRYQEVKLAAQNCQVYQGHISYIKHYSELFDRNWSYPGVSHEKIKFLHQQLNIRKPYLCLQIRNNKIDINRSSNVLDSESYHLAVRFLIQKGYQIILIGHDAPCFDSILSSNNQDAIIQYGKSVYQSIENDLLIVSQCEFFIGCCSGPTNYAHLFKKPVLILNCTTIGLSSILFNHRFYCKSYSWINGKELTLVDILSNPIVFSIYNQDAKNLGIELKNMSENEILEAISEFLECCEKDNYDWRKLDLIQSRYRDHLSIEHMIGYYSEGVPLTVWCKKMNIV